MYVTKKIVLRWLAGLSRAVFGAAEVLIIIRVLLDFFRASESSQFVAWMNSATDPLLRPFVGIFPSFEVGRFIIETYAIFGLIVYAFVGFMIAEGLSAFAHHRALRHTTYTRGRPFQK